MPDESVSLDDHIRAMWSWRGKERGVSFCAAMLGAFRTRAGFRVVQTKRGPRWVAGFEPEKLVGPTQRE